MRRQPRLTPVHLYHAPPLQKTSHRIMPASLWPPPPHLWGAHLPAGGAGEGALLRQGPPRLSPSGRARLGGGWARAGEWARGGGRHAARAGPPGPAASGKSRRPRTPRTPLHARSPSRARGRAHTHAHAHARSLSHTLTQRETSLARLARLSSPRPPSRAALAPAKAGSPLPPTAQFRGCSTTAARRRPPAPAQPLRPPRGSLPGGEGAAPRRPPRPTSGHILPGSVPAFLPGGAGWSAGARIRAAMDGLRITHRHPPTHTHTFPPARIDGGSRD